MNLLAQCVMCGRTAAAQQAARGEVFHYAILILLLPPFLIIGALLWLGHSRSLQSDKRITVSRGQAEERKPRKRTLGKIDQ